MRHFNGGYNLEYLALMVGGDLGEQRYVETIQMVQVVHYYSNIN